MDLKTIRQELKKLNAEALSEIKRECSNIPQNPDIHQISSSPMIYTISLKALQSDVLSAEYYNFAYQGRLIQKRVEEAKSFEECISMLQRICGDKKVTCHGETCLIHSKVLEKIQAILQEVFV